MIRLGLAYMKCCARCERPSSPAVTPEGAVKAAYFGDKWRKGSKKGDLICKPCYLLGVGGVVER